MSNRRVNLNKWFLIIFPTHSVQFTKGKKKEFVFLKAFLLFLETWKQVNTSVHHFLCVLSDNLRILLWSPSLSKSGTHEFMKHMSFICTCVCECVSFYVVKAVASECLIWPLVWGEDLKSPGQEGVLWHTEETEAEARRLLDVCPVNSIAQGNILSNCVWGFHLTGLHHVCESGCHKTA